jgi:hypothetical protein
MVNNIASIRRRITATYGRLMLAFSVLLVVASSCNNSENIPDVSNIKVSLQTRRLDLDLARIDTNHIAAGMQQLYKKYPDFLNFYLDTLMGFKIYGNYSDTAQGIQQGLKMFLTYKDYRGLFDTVAKHFPDTKDIEANLTQGFQFLKYYFPNYQVPKIIYLTSGLGNWGAFTYESSTIGIGLDMFLGDKYPYYRSVGIPDYMNTHMRPSYIPVAVFSTIYEDTHPLQMDERTLLDMMIQRGKEQYFLHKVLPHTADSSLFGFTQAQVDWCKGNDEQMYNFFSTNNLFYNKAKDEVMRYVTDGPFATGMPSQSPANVGSWIGYEIVKSYMQQHPKTSLPELLAKEMDPQLFLEQSKYKPR